MLPLPLWRTLLPALCISSHDANRDAPDQRERQQHPPMQPQPSDRRPLRPELLLHSVCCAKQRLQPVGQLPLHCNHMLLNLLHRGYGPLGYLLPLSLALEHKPGYLIVVYVCHSPHNALHRLLRDALLCCPQALDHLLDVDCRPQGGNQGSSRDVRRLACTGGPRSICQQ